MGRSYIPMHFGEGYLSSQESQPHTSPLPAQGSSARKITPHNFWLQNPVGIESVEKLQESHAVPLKEPSCGLTQMYSL